MRGLVPHLCRPTTDRIKKGVRIAQEGLVFRPQHAEPGIRDLQFPFRVLDEPEIMDAAVELDDEFDLRAEKVDDLAGHGSLPSEFEALESAASQ